MHHDQTKKHLSALLVSSFLSSKTNCTMHASWSNEETFECFACILISFLKNKLHNASLLTTSSFPQQTAPCMHHDQTKKYLSALLVSSFLSSKTNYTMHASWSNKETFECFACILISFLKNKLLVYKFISSVQFSVQSALCATRCFGITFMEQLA